MSSNSSAVAAVSGNHCIGTVRQCSSGRDGAWYNSWFWASVLLERCCCCCCCCCGLVTRLAELSLSASIVSHVYIYCTFYMISFYYVLIIHRLYTYRYIEEYTIFSGRALTVSNLRCVGRYQNRWYLQTRTHMKNIPTHQARYLN